MRLYESAEMYLETIYTLAQRLPGVRSVDVAEALGYSRPSVSRAVGLLKKDGYLTVDDSGFLTLTQQGVDTAKKVFERHTVLTNALIALGVDRECAAEDACRIEHVISDQSLSAIKTYLETKGNI